MWLRRAGKLLAAYALYGPLMFAALWERRRSDGRRTTASRHDVRPRLFWGTEPLINMKYHSEAMKRLGYVSVTAVNSVYGIHHRSDYDVHVQDLLEECFWTKWLPSLARRLFQDYAAFLWALAKFDVFNFYFVGGILRDTPLKYQELQLLHLAGKKTVFMAYGSDVQVMSRFKGLLFKHAQCMDYPRFTKQEPETLRSVEYCSRYADYVIAGADWVDYMPRWDALIAGHFAIDTEEWKPEDRSGDWGDRRPVVVLHAPNHREIKGTRFLIQACEELKKEGVPIELKLVEKVPNARIKELMAECDIVADQFIVGWYALFAIEGMSMGKPVMTYLRPDLAELYTVYSYGADCPLVNTHPLHIKDILKRLVGDAPLRSDLGRQGRQYVEKYHSLQGVGLMLDAIYRRVWPGGVF
jgi:glycosyltransferase involved in cell wall biosynthesis